MGTSLPLHKRGKTMKKYSILFLLCAAMCLLLTGCGEKTADEAQLKNDLYSSDIFSKYANLNMTITDLEIIKRQTTEADKTDAVWVKVDAASDAIEGTLYFEMDYSLYNDGWLLDSVRDDSTDLWHFTPLSGVSDEMIQQYIPSEATIDDIKIDLEGCAHTVSYTLVEPHTYCDVIYKETLLFLFQSGHYQGAEWYLADTMDNGSYEDWKITGEWYGVCEKVLYKGYTAWLSVEDFSPPVGYILSCCDGYTDYFEAQMSIKVCDSDGRVLRSCSGTTEFGCFTGYTSNCWNGTDIVSVSLFISYDKIYYKYAEGHEGDIVLKPAQ